MQTVQLGEPQFLIPIEQWQIQQQWSRECLSWDDWATVFLVYVSQADLRVSSIERTTVQKSSISRGIAELRTRNFFSSSLQNTSLKRILTGKMLSDEAATTSGLYSATRRRSAKFLHFFASFPSSSGIHCRITPTHSIPRLRIAITLFTVLCHNRHGAVYPAQRKSRFRNMAMSESCIGT